VRKILLNAMPLAVVGTGVGRYLRGLYGAIEDEYQDSFQISYFIGNEIVSAIPPERGPSWKERVGQLLWKMPYPVALGARLLRHHVTERRFRKVCSEFDGYHEAGYFPIGTQEDLKTVMTVHDLSLLLYPQWHPKERVAYWQKFFFDRANLVNSFCAVSDFTKREMVKFLSIDPGLIHVTPLGVDKNIFNQIEDHDAQLFLESFDLPEEYILFVGSGDPRKNLDLVIEALKFARTSLPLVVVGWSGWQVDRAVNTIKMGYVSDRALAQLYRRAKLFVMPSDYEGFGLPVVEAMACGCPVLTSRAEALMEVGAGAVEYIFDVWDVPSFGAKIDELVESESAQEVLAAKGIHRAGEFSWGHTACLTIAAWNMVFADVGRNS